MHVNIRNNEIIDFNSKYLDEDILRVETTQEMYNLYMMDNRAVIYRNGEIIKNPEYENIQLQQAKEDKIAENDKLRDEKLNEGVVYSNVLFDSDTDQKVNLLATYNGMTDEDTIVWYGKDNQGLLCAKSDLLAIGGLITQLHSYCWNMNAHVKEQIEQAQTIEQLNSVIIDYE